MGRRKRDGDLSLDRCGWLACRDYRRHWCNPLGDPVETPQKRLQQRVKSEEREAIELTFVVGPTVCRGLKNARLRQWVDFDHEKRRVPPHGKRLTEKEPFPILMVEGLAWAKKG